MNPGDYPQTTCPHCGHVVYLCPEPYDWWTHFRLAAFRKGYCPRCERLLPQG